MTNGEQERIECVVVYMRQIIGRSSPKLEINSVDRIIRSWFRIPNEDLDFRTPLDVILDDYPSLLDHVELMYQTTFT